MDTENYEKQLTKVFNKLFFEPNKDIIDHIKIDVTNVKEIYGYPQYYRVTITIYLSNYETWDQGVEEFDKLKTRVERESKKTFLVYFYGITGYIMGGKRFEVFYNIL